ncbi:MAG: 50S ribosomal protein L6 [Planctomycetota bacterium]
MSRVGKKPISVPSGVKISLNGQQITVEGKKGSLTLDVRKDVKLTWDESEKSISVGIDEKDADNRAAKAQWGTTRALVQNMIFGVTDGYEKKLEIVGVGWNAEVQGQKLKVNVGYADPRFVSIPEGVTVTAEKQNITIAGPDKQQVGQMAAEVRATRKPEPYNGKGVKYANEVIRRKQGKQFGS